MTNAGGRLTERLLNDTVFDKQIALEETAIAEGARRYRDVVSDATRRGSAAGLKTGERFVLHWFEPFVAMIEREQEEVLKGVAKKKGVNVWGPLFVLLDAPRIAVATIHEALGECLRTPSGVKYGPMCYQIGASLIAEAHKDMLKDDEDDAWLKLERRVRSLTIKKINWWAKRSLRDPIRSRTAATHVGVIAFDLLLNSASAGDYMEEAFDPAFKIERKTEGRKSINYVVLSDRVRREIGAGHQIRQFLRPKKLPMVYPPFPWSKENRGGYIKIKSKLISNTTSEQDEAIAAADMSAFYDRINAINAPAWRIRKRVHRVLEWFWESGGGRVFPNGVIELRVPPQENPVYPPKPNGYDAGSKDPWESVDPGIKREYKIEASRIHESIELIDPAREEFLRKMWIVRRFANEPKFYFPHYCDFRWRCYPDVPHFNHQGDDVCRGLLEWANPVPATDEGRRWIKIHAANCYGFDKATFDARVAWVDSQMDNIRRVAECPEENDFWRPKYNAAGKQIGGPKKPWQFLSTCFALCNEDDAAHHACQIDGSCNGLQHYSAIGRDEHGARLVNVAPSDKPNDVYSAVAAALIPLIDDDQRNSEEVIRWTSWADGTKHEKPVKEIAAEVASIVDRSVVKQTVMTKVYGVTENGARGQIYDRLKEHGVNDRARYAASAYLGNRVMDSIGATCSGAAKIMDWIRTCAGLIARSGRLVRWTSEIGCPIVQPYRNDREHRVATIRHCITLRVDDRRLPVKVDKHINGSAPDFIHGVDAAHMFNTGYECYSVEIDFAAVHDGYFGHAEHMGRIHRITVDEFVKLHRIPMLQKLHDEWRRIYPDIEFPPPPSVGNLDIEDAARSTYLFG